MDMDINVIDLVLGASLLYGLVNGLYKGFFIEVASLLGLICGVYGAIHFSHFATSLIKQKVEWDEQYINIIAFAITFIFIVFVVSLVGKTLTKLANFIALGVLNKIFGAVFGVLKIGLILSIILMLFSNVNKTIPFVDQKDIDESVLYEHVRCIAPYLYPVIINIDSKENSKPKEVA